MEIMKIVAGLALYIGSMLYHGFSLMYLWAWFMVPFGLPPITLPWAIGLSVLVASFRGFNAVNEDESLWFTLFKLYAAVTLFLVLGWFVHGFM